MAPPEVGPDAQSWCLRMSVLLPSRAWQAAWKHLLGLFDQEATGPGAMGSPRAVGGVKGQPDIPASAPHPLSSTRRSGMGSGC